MTIAAIQVLRAAASLMVVVHHAGHEALRAAPSAPLAALVAAMPWWAGVDVFFVISGFIIVHAAAGDRSAARFLARRVARVVPLYWIVTLAYLAAGLAVPSALGAGASGLTDPLYVAASFLFWPAARPDGIPQPVYGLGWTLNCEMFFYVLFALGLGRGRRAAGLWTAAALCTLVAAGALVPLAALPLSFWSNQVMLEFVLGAGIAGLRARGVALPRAARLGLAAAGIAGLALAGHVAQAETLGRPVLFGLPAALLVAAAALGRSGEGRPGRRPGALVVLGDASYALYLVHPFALRAAAAASRGLDLGGWGSLAAGLAASVALALLVHWSVEKPLTRRLYAVIAGGAQARARPAPGSAGNRV